MIKYDYGLICERAIVDQRSNQLSLINVYEDFITNAFPILVPTFTILTTWSIEKEEVGQNLTAEIKIEIDGVPEEVKEALSASRAIIFEDEKRRVRLIHQFVNFPIMDEGKYKIVIKHNKDDTWKNVGAIEYIATEVDSPSDINVSP